MTAPIKRKLIEVALPLEAINVASAREKSIRHGHPSTLHLWWARRPLAACRAVLFASLVDDPSSDPDRFPTPKAVEDERTRLFGIIERMVLWENSSNESVLEEARAEIRRSNGGNPPSVLDPFCGGGSIPLEAQRLGLTAYASDLNPVAVLITKALIEIPPKFANLPPVHPEARRGIGSTGAWKGASGLAEDVRRYGTWMREEAERRIGHLYPKVLLPKEHGGGEATVIAWLWARTVVCPNPACRSTMPLARSFALSTQKGKEAHVEPIVDREARRVRFEVRSGRTPAAGVDGTSTILTGGKRARSSFTCLVCGSGIAEGGYIDAEAAGGRMGAVPFAVVAEALRGRVYIAADDTVAVATDSAAKIIAEPDVLGKLPTEPARGTFASNAQGRVYGFRRFRDYFTPRQLVALTTFTDLVGEARERILRDAVDAGMTDDGLRLAGIGTGAPAYADAVATYLGFAVDKASNRNCSLCIWEIGMGRLVAAFGRQGLSMSWDFAETNPLAGAGGDIRGAAESVAEVVDRLGVGTAGRSVQADAAHLADQPVPVVVSTDPPYYDNIEYADLSDFFYVWLRRALGAIYPELFSTALTPKSAELVASAQRFAGSRKAARDHFESGLGHAFSRIREAADASIPVTIFYAFRQSESEGDGSQGSVASTGWETMLQALLASGFAIDGTWPMRTEQGSGLRVIGANALASSIVLVCRPRPADAGITTRKGFVGSLKSEMPEALRTLQHGNIAPVDLAQSSIGPGMAIFSRYSKVLEPDGSAMSVRIALALINQVLDEILTEQEGEFDADTRWAIAWYEQFGLAESAYGTAETLSKAKNSSVAGLVEAGIVAAARGRARLLARAEYSPNWDPTKDARVPVWEATQRLVHVLLTDGEVAAGDLLARLGGLGDTARDLAYRMYHVAERKGWTDEARAYNALVVAWTDLARGAESARTVQPTQPNLGLE